MSDEERDLLLVVAAVLIREGLTGNFYETLRNALLKVSSTETQKGDVTDRLPMWSRFVTLPF